MKSSDVKEYIKSTQEQAVASWINYLNQVRLDNLLSTLAQQDVNLRTALGSVDEALKKIGQEIVGRNRGGLKGMHGFIAEVAEVGVGNAKEQILGQEAIYTLLDDNGPVDLVRNGIDIQQKFSMAGGQFSLGAVAEHIKKYPDYVNNGGKYQIPRDHYDALRTLLGIKNEKDAVRLLSSSGDGPSTKEWRRIHRLFKTEGIQFETLEPSNFEYGDVQRGRYGSTLEAEKESLRSTDRSLRSDAHQESRPSFQEGTKATAIAAAIEGGTALVLAIQTKRKEGKQLKDFDSDDWTEILGEAGQGTVKGGVRGFSLYALTNFTATSAAVASSIVTASFSIAEQAHLLRKNEISEIEFIENAETVCIETAVSALSSLIGQVLIPIPVLGAIIGNSVGQIMYKAVSASLSEREVQLVERYMQNQRQLDEKLAAEYAVLIESLDSSLASYLALLEQAFDPDPATALMGSIELAHSVGVPAEDILGSPEKTMSYFLD